MYLLWKCHVCYDDFHAACNSDHMIYDVMTGLEGSNWHEEITII